MKGSLDVCLSARPQRAEEMVGVYCFSSCHTITKKQTNTVNYKIDCPLCIHLEKGLKRDRDGGMRWNCVFIFLFQWPENLMRLVQEKYISSNVWQSV